MKFIQSNRWILHALTHCTILTRFPHYNIPDFCATLYTAHNTTNLSMMSKNLSSYKTESKVLRVQVRGGCVLQTYLHRLEKFQVRKEHQVFFSYVLVQVNQRCSTYLKDFKLEDHSEDYVFYCTCPGCSVPFYMFLIFVFCILLLLGLAAIIIKTKPCNYLHEENQYERLYDETSL